MNARSSGAHSKLALVVVKSAGSAEGAGGLCLEDEGVGNRAGGSCSTQWAHILGLVHAGAGAEVEHMFARRIALFQFDSPNVEHPRM